MAPRQVPQVWQDWLEHAVNGLKKANLLRALRPLEVSQPGDPGSGNFNSNGSLQGETGGNVSSWERTAVEITVSDPTYEAWLRGDCTSGLEEAGEAELGEGQSHRLRLFSGNDYLGLSAHPAVRAAAAKAALEHGMGPRASPLVCGYTKGYRHLEASLAALKGTEDSLLFPTGFAANMGVITAVCFAAPTPFPPGDSVAVFSDALNHASIIDGVRLAQKSRQVVAHVYRHCDMVHLEELLSTSKALRKVVVTDSLFSMDGDFAPLDKLAALRRKYGFLLVVDEAHATLVCGSRGGGAAEAFGVSEDIDLHVGTLSKAVGCQGGFVASSHRWKLWILSRGRSYIFSTALAAPTVAAASASVATAAQEPWRRRKVWSHVERFSKALGVPSSSPIVGLVVGGESEALEASRALLLAGFHVPAIRPPTVPKGSSRLRITFSAAHSMEDVEALIAAIPGWVKTRAVQFVQTLDVRILRQELGLVEVQNGRKADAEDDSTGLGRRIAREVQRATSKL